jgi:FtsH-binding integral membrane protein
MNNSYAYAQERTRTLMYTVFGWMSFALTLTGLSAYYVASTPSIMLYLYQHAGIVIGLVLFQFALVIALSGFVNRLSFTTALVIFMLYAVLTGVMLSSIFVVYKFGSIVATFFVAAGMFGAMALYGAFTKADLTGLGSFLMMALWGLILALVVNMFLQSPAFDYITAMAGVVIFALLTAWDVQRVKALAQYELPEAASITLALSLYLNFINLFLDLLRIMGDRRD